MKNSKCIISHEIKATLMHFSVLNRIFIGYSGGVDSHVLLAVCATFSELKSKITAVYIHHGLQTDADYWEHHCKKIADNLGVSFLTKRVNAFSKQGESPEEAARNARYHEFKNLVTENDVLLIAHHREDQLETLLLQLFRGSGLKGLAGIPEKIPFGTGHLLRPLLKVSKESIQHYAVENKLTWIEDLSNQSPQYDRNFLRLKIIPQLKERWTSLDKTVARTATHCAEADSLITEMIQTKFEIVFNHKDQTLNITKLLRYSKVEQRLILRQWFERLKLKMPSQDFLQRILNEVVFARIDRHPMLRKKNVIIRRQKLKLECHILPSDVTVSYYFSRLSSNAASGSSSYIVGNE